jgi:glycosyl transferase family 87
VFSLVNVAPRRLVVAPALGILAVALLLDVAIRNDPISVDFHTYLAAAQVGLTQGWSNVYDQGLVMVEQELLVPGGRLQPFLSPPLVAFVVSPLAALPYNTAYAVWAVLMFVVLALALAWSSVSPGAGRWIGVLGALTPWWVMHAVNVGQVVPLVAAGMVVGWRLLRDRRDVLAGVAIAAMLFKPNTAMLVPLALLFMARYRALAAWSACAVITLLAALVVLGPHGLAAYVSELRSPWPTGADRVTLYGAMAATGVVAAVIRILIVGAVLATAYRLRESPGLVIPLAIIGSLLVSPYLHGADLCLLAAAGWMMWEERRSAGWRALLAVAWITASPFLYLRGDSPELTQWPWLEVVLFLAVLAIAWSPLTAWGVLRRRAPA